VHALVVDDSRAMRRFVSGILEGVGFETVQFVLAVRARADAMADKLRLLGTMPAAVSR
jgi:CheY-like chemotaxis protein